MTRRRTPPLALLTLAIVALALGGWWLATAPGLSSPSPARLDALKTTGLAALEGGHYEDSDRAFTELVDRLPDDPLGARNLTISRLLALREAAAPQRATLVEQAAAALAQLRRIEPDASITHLLAARVAQASGDQRAAFDAMSMASERAPDDPGLWYELYTLVQNAGDAAQLDAGKAALRRAHALSPGNVRVLVEVLLLNAAQRDAATSDTLAMARETLAPFFATIQAQTRVNLAVLIDEAQQAVNDADWPTVSQRARVIANVLRPEVASRLDHRRLLRHELEYVLSEFGPEMRRELLALAPPHPAPIAVSLTLATDAPQFPPLTDVQAATLADLDLDGRLDLVVARARTLEVYVREAAGWTLADALGVPLDVRGIVAADLDRDSTDSADTPTSCGTADLDLIVYGAQGIILIESRLDPASGQRRLVAVKQVPGLDALRDVLAAAVADVDHDGDLDLLLSSAAGISVWSNHGALRFTDITKRSAMPAAAWRAGTLLPIDWNRTVDTDILFAGAGGVGILENHRHGRFRWRRIEEIGSAAQGASALIAGDFDGNVSWDVIVAGEQDVTLALTQTPLAATVRPLASRTLAPLPAPSTAASASALSARTLGSWDYDNDGYLDLLGWGAHGIDVWRGGPKATFEPVAGLFNTAVPGPVRHAEPADIDGDGDLDLLVLGAGRVVWYDNQGGNRNHWMDIALSGQRSADQKDERVNIHGVGSLLEVKAGTQYQARIVSGPRTHFGLGQHAQADVARVLWTNGIPQSELRPAADQPICATQILKGSCPYLYTWNGTRFEFMTDLLWAAPIGLQFAENVLAKPREWEYLRIPADKLVATNGEYRVQITEELWEAAYFDRVSLIAVDHPRDVDIYSNEKVGPPALAEFKVHTARQPRSPIAAHDHRGRDVLDLIAKRDDRYLSSVHKRRLQGLLEAHFIELDLGALQDPQQVKLFLTGWLKPTDTSLNIAISQNPDIDAPQPPSLWVPDATGQWQQVRPFIGFPGGKTKTIVVDLSGAFLTDDYRVRVATSMELYWDQIFFTVDEAPGEVRLTPLKLLRADLHYRGFSRRVEHPHNGPESYDYADVRKAPQWPPMQGRFTDYGDVTTLVNATDNRLLVMGAGDEMTIRFQVPTSDPPPGWTRDFLLHNVGWDKDADLNTVHGDMVEPLPYAGMKAYPDPLGEPPPASALHAGFAARNRTQDARHFWRQVVEFNNKAAANDRSRGQ